MLSYFVVRRRKFFVRSKDLYIYIESDFIEYASFDTNIKRLLITSIRYMSTSYNKLKCSPIFSAVVHRILLVES